MTDAAPEELTAEIAEALERLARDASVLEQTPGEPHVEDINAAFRSAHTLKGLLRYGGRDAGASMAHLLEELLDALRAGHVEPTDSAWELLVDATEALGALLATKEGEAPPPVVEDCKARVGELVAQGSGEKAPLAFLPEDVRIALSEYEEARLRLALKRRDGIWWAHLFLRLESLERGIARVRERVQPVGEVVATLPSALDEAAPEGTLGMSLLVVSRQTSERLGGALEGEARWERLVEAGGQEPGGGLREGLGDGLEQTPPGGPEQGVSTAAGQARSSTPREAGARDVAPGGSAARTLTSGRTVRVDIERLDRLMGSLGELLTVQRSLEALADSAGRPELRPRPKLLARAIGRESRLLARKLAELQEGLLETRMVPLTELFARLERLTRRAAREAERPVRLEVRGSEVQLDKLIVEGLTDPLMHLLRNAIAHGVEEPERRSALSKPPEGQLRLVAEQRGAKVSIEVADDGAGFDEARLRTAAIEAGLQSAGVVDALPRKALLELAFAPGLSTADSVSELSGRGVGLDVVRSEVGRLSGVIELESEPGRGTTFRLLLPLTLSLVKALLVSVAGRTYALPVSGVVEVVELPGVEGAAASDGASVREASEGARASGAASERGAPEGATASDPAKERESLNLRGRRMPLVSLAEHFGHPGGRPPSFAVVAGLAEERVALGVDALHGQQDLVVKPLGEALAGVRGFAGASDVGGDAPALVLDLGALVKEVLRLGAGVESSGVGPEALDGADPSREVS